jgi:F420-dependent oxidoreductase-like protein
MIYKHRTVQYSLLPIVQTKDILIMVQAQDMLQSSQVQPLPTRERVGLVIDSSNATSAIMSIIDAENAGVRQVWTTQGPQSADALTTFAAAAVQTHDIRMGTAIVPTYPRHPLTLATQAFALNDIAPGRLRLGIGPSHRPTIEGMYGIPMKTPLEHLREYMTVLRSALWEGKVDFHGNFYNVTATLPRQAHVPILTSTLGPEAFKVAGEIADGGLSWLCPVPYLLKTSLPNLQTGAQEQKRPAPPLVAHVLVAVSTDRDAVIEATRKQISRYGHLPFYANMFAESGHPVASDGTMPDDLIDTLVISGDDAAIFAHFSELLTNGLDELLALIVPVNDRDTEWKHLANLIGHL